MAVNESIRGIKNYLAEQFHLKEEQIESMLPGFISTLATHLQKLESAVDGNNPFEIGRAAHTLKGALLNLGLEECAKTALFIEEKGKTGESSTDFKKLVDDLRVRMTSLINEDNLLKTTILDG